MNATTPSDIQNMVSAEEWQLRVDLAACYRLVALYGWSDLVFTHISARIPGPEHHFLINPYGLMFDEITASSLVKVDMQCNKLIDSPYPVNPAGFVIHSSVHAAREDVQCVLHTHTGPVWPSAPKRTVCCPSASKAPLGWHRWRTTATKVWRSATKKSRACRPTWARPTSSCCATTAC